MNIVGASSRNRMQNRIRAHLRRHGTVCAYCDRALKVGTFNQPLSPSRDHAIPLSRGGADSIDNIVIACRECNSDKGSLLPEEYMAVRGGLASRLDKGRPGPSLPGNQPSPRRDMSERFLAYSIGDFAPGSPFDKLRNWMNANVK